MHQGVAARQRKNGLHTVFPSCHDSSVEWGHLIGYQFWFQFVQSCLWHFSNSIPWLDFDAPLRQMYPSLCKTDYTIKTATPQLVRSVVIVGIFHQQVGET